ncbi:Hsp20/alpha crystallin family protein [Marinobacter hydrocarbonoclasticus]|nr:Hsp20/alpha crystallin family protein [Marinobacter nauticus]
MKKRNPSVTGLDHPFGRLAQRMPTLSDRWDRDWLPLWGEVSDVLLPAVDLKEEEEKLVLKADLPGFSEKEIELTCVGDRLSLKARRETEKAKETDDYHMSERHYGSYQRTVVLPFAVRDPEAIRAHYEKGVLTVEIPKSDAVKMQQRPIPIRFEP